jgi:hypothetical protein
MLLLSPATFSLRRALCKAARPKGAPLGPGKRSLDWLHLRDLRQRRRWPGRAMWRLKALERLLEILNDLADWLGLRAHTLLSLKRSLRVKIVILGKWFVFTTWASLYHVKTSLLINPSRK